MTFTNTIKVDVGHPWKTTQVYVKQGDKDSRKIRAELMNGAASWTIPVGTVATFRAKKPDDTIVTQDATIGSPNIVEVVLDEQVGAVFGVVRGEIRLVNGGEILNTFLIAINVEAAAVTDGDIVSRDVLDEYQALVDQMLAVAGSPLVANAAADMTDKTRVYVYTGSEVGYVTGDWYFWDGAAWTAGGVYNSQGIGDAFIEQTAEYIKQSAVATESDSTPYLYRPTPNPSAILADEELIGGTIAWNQYAELGSGGTSADITATVNADNSVSFSGTTTGGYNYNFGSDTIPIISSHVYLFGTIDSTSATGGIFRLRDVTNSTNVETLALNGTKKTAIAKAMTTGNGRLYVNASSANITMSCKIYPQVFDLTACFGATIADYLYTLESGTPGAGVAKLREWGFLSKEYFAYDAGSLKSVNTEGKRVTGSNIFGGSLMREGIKAGLGSYTEDATANTIAFAQNASAVQPFTDACGLSNNFKENTRYTIIITGEKTAASNCNIRIYYTDGTYSSFGAFSAANTKETISVTTAAGKTLAYITKYNSASGTVTIYCNESGIFEGANHQFFPFKYHTYPTTPTDLNGIFKLDANNQLYADGDVYGADGTVTRRFTDLDLGQRNWTYVSAENRFYTSVPDADFPTDNTKVADIICAEYPTVDYATLLTLTQDKVISAWKSGSVLYIIVRDTGYSSAAAFKTAMSGVYAYYKLATPTTETADPFTATQIVGKGGTEEWVDSRAVPVPVGHRTTYSIGVPDVPANATNATLKATVSGGKTTLSWS